MPRVVPFPVRRIRLALTMLVALALLVAVATTRPVAAATAGYQDFSYGSSLTAPTGEKPQSKLWYTDGTWWGVLWDKTSPARFKIWRFNAATQKWAKTSTVVETRRTSNLDVLWDGARLYVLSAKTAGSSTSDVQMRFMVFSYGSGAYRKTSTTTVSQKAVEAAVMDKDSRGVFWVTYTDKNGAGGRSVYVAHSSTGGTTTWTAPYVLPVAGATSLSADDISSVVSYSGKIGVMWSNQADNRLYWAVHVDGADDRAWTGQVVAGGPKLPDDHLNLKSLVSDQSGRVFAIVKTSLDDKATPNPDDPIIVLWVLNGGTTWVSSTVWKVRDNATRGIVLIDSGKQNVYAFATAPTGGGVIYLKKASYAGGTTTSLPFPTGLGSAFIASSGSQINNATSTKQEVSSSTGLLVEASDDGSRYYVHGYVTP